MDVERGWRGHQPTQRAVGGVLTAHDLSGNATSDSYRIWDAPCGTLESQILFINLVVLNNLLLVNE